MEIKISISTPPWSVGAALADADGSIPIMDGDGCIVALVMPAFFHKDGKSEDLQMRNAEAIAQLPELLGFKAVPR